MALSTSICHLSGQQQGQQGSEVVYAMDSLDQPIAISDGRTDGTWWHTVYRGTKSHATGTSEVL